jgi:hypothetical protein
MYFYTISNGCYSDYSNSVIYHEKKFSNKEFVAFYNQALKSMGTDDDEYPYHDGVAEKLVELFDFKLVEEQFEIWCDYGHHRPIDIGKITEDEKCYNHD